MKVGDLLDLPGRKKPVKVIKIGNFSVDFETEKGKRGALIQNVHGPIYLHLGGKYRRIK